MPIGAVGELVIEGPLAARGYLNDHETAEAVFVKNPAWLLPFSPDCNRVYKTGGLA